MRTASSKDFFISYNHRDAAWAEWIAWQLEGAGYTTIIQAWDSSAGSNFVLEMDRSVKEAQRLIAVLSTSYLNSGFAASEWAAKFGEDPKSEDCKVIPVRIADVHPQGLLSTIAYIDLVGKDETNAVQELLSRVKHARVKHARSKPLKAPSFPGKSKPLFPGNSRGLPATVEGHTNGAEGGEPYIVGRDEEVRILKRLMEETRSPSVLNIYGPAGIGKTTLCEKLRSWCKSQQIPSATVDLYSLFNVTVRAIACKLREMLVSVDNQHATRWSFQDVQHAFREFDQLVQEHDQIKSAITRHGDLTRVFDKFGFLKEGYRLSFSHGVFARREGLEKYLREVDGMLAESFVQGVASLAHSRPLVLFVDTWEKLEYSPDVEEWLSVKLLRNLPPGVTAVLFGRSQVQKFAGRLGVWLHLLEALSEADTKAYLRHHGLQDHKALDAIFEVTGGYPLCLALACELSRKARSWDAVSRISVAREAIAEELLKRLLEEEGVEEVRDFLEKGIVAEWFDRGSIRYILGVSETKAKKIYQRIKGYSFVRPHPYGLQFHEGIRDILRRRLEAQNKKEYARLTKKWADYFRKSREELL